MKQLLSGRVSTKALIIASTVILLSLATHLLINVRNVRGSGKADQLRLDPLTVQGLAADYQGVLYTLNFAQEKTLLPGLNSGVRLQETPLSALEALDIKHLIIYRFHRNPLQIEIAGSLDERLVFRCEAWENGRWLVENRASDASLALRSAYDQ